MNTHFRTKNLRRRYGLPTIAVLFVLTVILIVELVGCTNGANASAQTDLTLETLGITEDQAAAHDQMDQSAEEYINTAYSAANRAAEEMLVYLETKYETKFSCIEYASGGVDPEHLIAYPVSSNPSDIVTLYRWTENGVVKYYDNYNEVAAKPFFAKAVAAFISEHTDISHTKIFVQINDAKDNTTVENAAKNVSAKVFLFVDGDAVSEETCQELGSACGQWLLDNCNGMASSLLLMRTDPDVFHNITESNYETIIWKDIFAAQIEYTVSSDGKLTVHN